MRACAVCGINIDHAHHLAKVCSEHCRVVRQRQVDREYLRAWKKRNPDRVRASKRRHRKSRPQSREYYRDYYAKNRDRLNAVHGQYNRECTAAVDALKQLGFTEALEAGPAVARRVLKELQLS